MSQYSFQKMPRRNLNLSEKKLLIDQSATTSPKQLAARNKISLSQTNKILAKKNYYLTLCDQVNNKLTRIREDKIDLEHDFRVLNFIDEYRRNGVPLDAKLIRMKATLLLDDREGENVESLSGTWWRHFKRRHLVTLGTICGEILSADVEAAENYKEYDIPEIFHD